MTIFLFSNFNTFFFFSLTTSATSSFHHHVSLWLHVPSDNPHVTCAVSIVIFFICCQCSFASRYYHKDSWKEYMEKLMNEDNEWDHRTSATVKEGPANCIRMDEVAAALKQMKRHKAPCLSGPVTEMIQATGYTVWIAKHDCKMARDWTCPMPYLSQPTKSNQEKLQR